MGGNLPNTLTKTHGFSAPYFSICSRAHYIEMRGLRCGSSGSLGNLNELQEVITHWSKTTGAEAGRPSRHFEPLMPCRLRCSEDPA